MKLYIKAGACPLASHIALYESGLPFEVETVDTATGLTASGANYRALNPKGYVPALELTSGDILTEGAAVLQFIADRAPAGELAPAPGTLARARLQELLHWIGAELHKAFSPLFRDGTTEEGKAAARTAVAAKFDLIEAQLSDGRNWLVEDRYSVADGYLFVVANWANFVGIDLPNWPHLAAHVARTAARPATQAALRAEGLIQ